MIHEPEEPWEQKMYRIFFRLLLHTREVIRRPLLGDLHKLESMIETELLLLETYGNNRGEEDEGVA